VDPQRGFAVMSSRCSYELVQKAARANIPLLCTVSAPTGLAVRLAEQAGLTLISLARGGSFLVLAGAHRIDWNTTVQHG
jgi:FdhD protein